MELDTVKQEGIRSTVATRMARRMIFGMSAGAALAAVLLLGAFTYMFALLLSPLGLLASLGWLLLLIGFAWAVNVGRAMSQLGPRLFSPSSRWAAASLQPGAGLVALAGAVIGTGWMFYAQTQPHASLVQRAHWFGQILLVIAMVAIIGRFFMNLRQQVKEDTGIAVMENAGKRDRLIGDLQQLVTSSWMAQFKTGSTGNRLRAALSWLVEEMNLSVPERGFVLAESTVSHFLEEQRRLVTFIQDLCERQESNDNNLNEAERRVLEGINKSARLARRIAA